MSPAVSESQRRLMAIALRIKRGELPRSVSKQAARMASTMSEEQLEEFARKPKGKKPFPFIKGG